MLTNRRNGSPMPTVVLPRARTRAYGTAGRGRGGAAGRRRGRAAGGDPDRDRRGVLAGGGAAPYPGAARPGRCRDGRRGAVHRTGGGPRAERARAHSAPDRPNVVPVGAATSIWRLRLVERGGRGRADGSGAARRSRRQP